MKPPWLDFQVLTPSPVPMAKGALIEYVIRLGVLPFGSLGAFFTGAIIRRRLDAIFAHHRKVIGARFGGGAVIDHAPPMA